MLYSLAELQRRQQCFYAAAQTRRAGRRMRPIAGGSGEALVSLNKVIVDGDGISYGIQRAHLFPEPGFPPDLPQGSESVGFPADLMELRLAGPPSAYKHVLSVTYPFTWGAVDVAPLLPRPRIGRRDLDSFRVEAQAREGTQALPEFLRRQPEDLWSCRTDRSGFVARLARPTQPTAPVAAREAVAAALRVSARLPHPTDASEAESFPLVSFCSDIEQCFDLVHESREFGSLELGAANLIGAQGARDLRLAASLWALAGPAFRAESLPDRRFEWQTHKSAAKRAHDLFRMYALLTATTQEPTHRSPDFGLQIPGDDVLGGVENHLNSLANSEGSLSSAVAAVAMQLTTSEVTLAAVQNAGALLMLVRRERERLLAALEPIAQSSPDAVLREHARVIVHLLGSV
jgi:hypothetical protein